MKYVAKKLEKAQFELVITVEPKDYEQNMQKAAVRLSERAAIKGFRAGKAPYAIVKEQLGEIKIMEEALESIVQGSFHEAVQKEKLETIGMPQITIEKMAPGNEVVYKAVVALLPKVKLPDLSTIKVECKEVKVEKAQADEVLDNLKKMQRRESAKADAATKEDKLMIDMEMFIDKVPMEGGQAKDHQVYMSEEHYIPGLTDQLVGLKKDDTKEFTLKFPKEHYQKQFAGKDVDFKVKVKEVFALNYPELNDDFAKTLGQESMAKLHELLQHNLLHEAERKEDQRVEIAILEQILEKTTFEEIPEILVNSEKRKMFYELKHNLDQHGVTMEQYLKDMKKTEEDIAKDFTEQATKRAKSALISRQVALDNDLKVEPSEMEAEIKAIKAAYPGDKNVEDNLQRPEVLETVATTIQNRKVVEFLKNKVLPGGMKKHNCGHDHKHE